MFYDVIQCNFQHGVNAKCEIMTVRIVCMFSALSVSRSMVANRALFSKCFVVGFVRCSLFRQLRVRVGSLSPCWGSAATDKLQPELSLQGC